MNPFAEVFKSFEEAFSCQTCSRSNDGPMVAYAQRIVQADVRTNPGNDNRMQTGNLVFFGEESAEFSPALAGVAAGSLEAASRLGRPSFSVTVGPQYGSHSGARSNRLDIQTRCATPPSFPR
jgi:hypothetical protein